MGFRISQKQIFSMTTLTFFWAPTAMANDVIELPVAIAMLVVLFFIVSAFSALAGAVAASFNLERWTAFRYIVLALFASQFVLFMAFADGELPQVRLIAAVAYQSVGMLPGYLWGYAARSTALTGRGERPAPKAAGPRWMMVEGGVFVVAMLALTFLMGRP